MCAIVVAVAINRLFLLTGVEVLSDGFSLVSQKGVVIFLGIYNQNNKKYVHTVSLQQQKETSDNDKGQYLLFRSAHSNLGMPPFGRAECIKMLIFTFFLRL